MSVCLFLFFELFSAGAVVPQRIDTARIQLQVPRLFLQSVRSLDTSPSDPIDTLDTVNEHVKVILFGDNTWRYYKTPDYKALTGIFDEYWNNSD